jgi:hypothetical protein
LKPFGSLRRHSTSISPILWSDRHGVATFAKFGKGWRVVAMNVNSGKAMWLVARKILESVREIPEVMPNEPRSEFRT